LTPLCRIRHNPPVADWKKLATAFLLLAVATMPTAVWAGTRLLQQHGYGCEAEHARHDPGLIELAEILVHGHQHREGTPDHQHNLLPSPPIRQEAPRCLQVSGVVSSDAPTEEAPLFSGTASAWQLPWRAGSSPPILHLLCSLLI